MRIELSPKSRDGVWGFFYEISDVTNLNPAEEQNEAWECWINDSLVGMAVVSTWGSRPHFVNRVAVEPEHRRKGAGKALLRHLVDKYEQLRCEVRPENKASRGMLESAGFEHVDTHEYDKLLYYEVDDSGRHK